MQNKGILEGFAPMDYEEVVDFSNMTVETIFEVFNGVVTAVESEANARASFSVETYGTIPYSEKRNLELVETYDEFVNSPKFELDAFSIGKMEMENFWASVGRRNAINICNKSVTYGKSTIYAVRRGKAVVGFLLNNMTYDGQNMYFLSSKHLGDGARALFKGTGKYPSSNKYVNRKSKVFNKIKKYPTRWTRINEYLHSIGANSVNAWSFLNSEDSRYFYGELKKYNHLSKADKQLLKLINKKQGGKTFYCLIEEAESRKCELEGKITEYYNSKEAPFAISDLVHYEWELEEIEANLSDWSEEDNSLSSNTTLDDYKW